MTYFIGPAILEPSFGVQDITQIKLIDIVQKGPINLPSTDFVRRVSATYTVKRDISFYSEHSQNVGYCTHPKAQHVKHCEMAHLVAETLKNKIYNATMMG